MTQLFRIRAAVLASGRPALDDEIRLIKTCLLIGDNTTIQSPKAWAALVMAQIPELDSRERIWVLARVLRAADESLVREGPFGPYMSELRSIEEKLGRGAPLTEPEELVLKKLKPDSEAFLEKMAIARRADGTDELQRAINSGFVQLAPSPFGGDVDRLTQAYVNEIAQIVTDPVAFPLFDDRAGRIAATHVLKRESSVTAIAGVRPRTAPIAAQLLQQLPVFERSGVDEILDIRRELSPQLGRFRGALLDYATSIESLPWDNSFRGEVDLMYHERVAPSLADLHDQIEAVPSLRELAVRIATAPTHPAAGSVVGLAVSAAMDLPIVAGVAIGAAAGIARETLQALRERAEERTKAKGNRLYFLYSLGSRR